MPRLSLACSKCQKYYVFAIPPKGFKEDISVVCFHCQNSSGMIKANQDLLDACPICQCRQFYLMKHFNQALGCSIMLVAIVLVPKTFGLSLPLFALFDWFLHKKSKNITVCYRCACEFHDFDHNKRFKPFMHHIGLKYDKYRSISKK